MNRLTKITQIRQCLKNGEPSIGSWMQIPHASVAEIMGQAGCDWVAVDMDKIRKPFTQDFSTELTFGTPRHHKTNDSFSIRQHTYVRHPLGKVPKDFIEYDVLKTTLNQSDKFVPDKNLEHSATFPEKLIKPFILGTSKEGDTILDPFLGGGTTAKVSLDNGRECIGYEISPVFVDTSYERCGEGLNQKNVKVM